jgi:hypothetical protein
MIIKIRISARSELFWVPELHLAPTPGPIRFARRRRRRATHKAPQRRKGLTPVSTLDERPAYAEATDGLDTAGAAA